MIKEYNALWSAYTIEFENQEGKYIFSTRDGIRGINMPTKIYFENGVFYSLETKLTNGRLIKEVDLKVK